MLFENIKDEIRYQMREVLSHYNLNENNSIDFEISEPPLKEDGDFSCILTIKNFKKKSS